MQRISTATAKVDKFGSGKPGFTEGDPQAGEAATVVGSEWLDDMQEEMCAPIEHVGRVPSSTAPREQLLRAWQDFVGLGMWDLAAPDSNVNQAIGWRGDSGGNPPVFVIFDGSNSKKTSVDGITWSSGSGLGAATEVYDVLWTGSSWYCAGNATSVGITAVNATFSSSTVYALGGVDYHAVAHFDGEFAVVGAGGSLYTSPDGSTWTPRTSGTASTLYAVATDEDGTWIAVGASGALTRSTTLTTWGTVASGTAATLRGVAHGTAQDGTGVWVIVGSTACRRSTNGGTSWSAASDVDGVANFWQVRWSSRHEVFVACGDDADGNGVLAISRDGDTWQMLRPRGQDRFLDVVQADDMLAAGGVSGDILTSGRLLRALG